MGGFGLGVRRMVWQRAQEMCECCGMTRGVHLHHRRARGMGSTKRPETNQPANALAVCLLCHERIESNRAFALQRGWLVPQNCDPAEMPVLYRGQWVRLDDNGNLLEVAA